MSRSRQKGTAAETAVADYLQANGFPYAERRALHGRKDLGDIAGIPGVVVEVKAGRASFGAWLAEAEQERCNAQAGIGVVIHKPPGLGPANVGRWHVVMTLHTFAELVREDR